MPTSTADIVIIGGAVVGSSIAYFLKRNGFTGRVVVVEKDPSYQWCATGRSVASIRQQFSTRENIELSRFGATFFSSIRDEFGPDADIAFRERGYLIMASPEGRPVLEQSIALQRSLGADTALLEPEDIARQFPWLSTEGLGAAGWGRSGEGWVDPNSLMQLFRKGAIARGVEYRAGEAIGITVTGGRIAGVQLASGDTIATERVVCAAGWHSAKVAAMASLSIPIRPRKRFVFVIDCRDPLPGAGLMIDPSGVYFRPEGKVFLAGLAPSEDRDPDAEDFDIDHAFFEDEIWPRLALRVPAFEAIKVQSAWCCHYDLNTFDHNAILGPHPDLPEFVLACGFSGHGLQHSPGVGRGIAEHLIHSCWQTIDLTRLGYARVTANQPLLELNVF
jgi:FAD-dependent oxidoreductase domain-containing protein 1